MTVEQLKVEVRNAYEWRDRERMERALGRMHDFCEPDELARRFHDLYEQLAPEFGYTTRPDTRQFDPATPNGKLMIAVCAALLGFPVPT